jgi:hypothetical protein
MEMNEKERLKRREIERQKAEAIAKKRAANIKKISQFPYMLAAHKTFRHKHQKIAERLEALPKENLYLLNNSIDDLLKIIEPGQSPARTGLEMIDRVISHDYSFNLLMGNFPTHMKMQVSKHHTSTSESRKKERDTYREYKYNKIRKQSISKSHQLQKLFRLNEGQLETLYNLTPTENDSEALQRQKAIIASIKVCRIKDCGNSDGEKSLDDLFCQRLSPSNRSSNIFLVPAHINTLREEFASAQTENIDGPTNNITYYLDLCPAVTSSEEIWTYSEIEAFLPENRVNPYDLLRKPPEETAEASLQPA